MREFFVLSYDDREELETVMEALLQLVSPAEARARTRRETKVVSFRLMVLASLPHSLHVRKCKATEIL